jgi:hypothetical protein
MDGTPRINRIYLLSYEYICAREMWETTEDDTTIEPNNSNISMIPR